jgi:hypothetical protein
VYALKADLRDRQGPSYFGSTLIRATSDTVLSVLFLENEITKSRCDDPTFYIRDSVCA